MIVEALISYVYDIRFTYQLIATLTTILTAQLVNFYIVRKRRYKLLKYYGIPGPEPRLFDGNFCEYSGVKGRFKVDAKFIKKYGKIFGVYIGNEPNLVISDVELLKRIFFDETKSFKERTNLFIDSSMNDGILFARNDRWKMMRRMLSPPFKDYTVRGQSSTQLIEDSIKLTIDYIEKKINQSTDGKVVLDIMSLMKSTALYLISNMAVRLPNVQVKENEDNVESLDAFLETCGNGVIGYAIRFPFLVTILSFLSKHLEHGKTMGLINRGLSKLIDEEFERLKQGRKQLIPNKKQVQLIDTLIRQHYEGKITRREVIGNAESILFAGYDTSSTTLSYVFWALAKNQEIQDKLRIELTAHGIDSHYLVQVLNETMRLYPTVLSFTTRLATETVKIDKWVIPEGTKVIYPAWNIYHDPDLWSNPEVFDPERFKEGKNIHPCAFAPFGLGERRCLGYQLAMLEMKIATCDILLRYRLKLKSPLNLEIISSAAVLTKPSEKILLELEKL